MKNKSILFIDSGIGGLSTLKTCRKYLKNENFIYYADSLNAPFGNKHKDFITTRMTEIIEKYISKIKAVVIACNTATSTSIKYLREHFSCLIFGIEPALNKAFKEDNESKILLLATPVTINRLFVFKKENIRYKERVIFKADANLSVDIEKNIFKSRYLKNRTKCLLSAFKNEPNLSIVLGCTHYIFIKKHISKLLPKAKIFDGNEGLAKRLFSVLKENELLSTQKVGKVSFKNSLNDKKVNRKMKKILKKC